MAKHLIDRDPITGEETWFAFDPATMQFRYEYRQELGRMLDDNVAAANDTDKTRRQMKRDLVHYARVPNTVIVEWKEKFGIDFFNPDHKAAVFRLLNSPEYRKFKRTNMVHHVRG